MVEKDESIRIIGKKMIETGVNLDESLVEILRIEIKRLKQLARGNNDLEELHKMSNLIKNIIIALTLTDEKIRTGIDLCMDNTKTEQL